MKFFSALLIMSVLLSVDGHAQRWIAYGKPGKEKFRIRLGNDVTFRVKPDKTHISGTLDEITENYVVVSGEWIMIDSIDQIVVTEPFVAVQKRANGLILSGISALMTAALNNWINRGEAPFDRASLIVSGSLIGTGLILKPFRARRCRIRGKKKLWVIDVW